MTAHIHSRTATDHRRSTVPSTTSTAPSTSSPKRPLPRWVAPFVVAAAICVAGVGVLVYDANSDLAPAPTPIEEPEALGEGQRLQPGLPDGYWQPAAPDAEATKIECGTSGPC
jgi:hypothetical protein